MMSDYTDITDYYSLLAMQNPGKCTYHGPSEPDDLIDRLRNAYQCCSETRDYAYLVTGIRRVEAARKSAG